MHIHEFGNKDNPVILLLPGTMCYWKGNFGNVIDELAKDFLLQLWLTRDLTRKIKRTIKACRMKRIA